MVMDFPQIVTIAFSGGLAGGFCWAKRAVAQSRSPVQMNRRFMLLFFLQAEAAL